MHARLASIGKNAFSRSAFYSDPFLVPFILYPFHQASSDTILGWFFHTRPLTGKVPTLTSSSSRHVLALVFRPHSFKVIMLACLVCVLVPRLATSVSSHFSSFSLFPIFFHVLKHLVERQIRVFFFPQRFFSLFRKSQLDCIRTNSSSSSP